LRQVCSTGAAARTDFRYAGVISGWRFGRPRRRCRHFRGYDETMTLAPLLNAPLAIQIHAFAALAAFALGIVQLAAPKGTLPHRTVGWTWVALMAIVSITAFFIHELRLWGPWSPIHLLAIFTLVMLPLAVLHARRHAVQQHRWSMIGIFTGALIVAGLFTFVPGRIMHAVLFGS
jgi:uncharacterized membrane protein